MPTLLDDTGGIEIARGVLKYGCTPDDLLNLGIQIKQSLGIEIVGVLQQHEITGVSLYVRSTNGILVRMNARTSNFLIMGSDHWDHTQLGAPEHISGLVWVNDHCAMRTG